MNQWFRVFAVELKYITSACHLRLKGVLANSGMFFIKKNQDDHIWRHTFRSVLGSYLAQASIISFIMSQQLHRQVVEPEIVSTPFNIIQFNNHLSVFCSMFQNLSEAVHPSTLSCVCRDGFGTNFDLIAGRVISSMFCAATRGGNWVPKSPKFSAFGADGSDYTLLTRNTTDREGISVRSKGSS